MVSGPWLLSLFFDLPLLFLVFALCRSKGSILAWLLSKSGINALAPYSYGIYLFHWPILIWVNFTAQGYGTTWWDIFTLDYSSMCFWPYISIDDKEIPPYIYISIYCVTIVLSVMCTTYVHEPFQRWWNSQLSSKADGCEKISSTAPADTPAPGAQVILSSFSSLERISAQLPHLAESSFCQVNISFVCRVVL